MKLFNSHIVIHKKLLISIEMLKDGYVLQYAVLKKGDSVENVQFQKADKLEEITELKKNIPISVHVKGFGVLTRQVENAPSYKDNLIVSGEKTDFYFSSYEEDQTITVSFVRKSLLKDVIDEIKVAKAFLFEVHVGPIPLVYLKDEHNKVSADYTIEFSQGKISSFERNQEENENRTSKYYLESYLTSLETEETEIQQALETVDRSIVEKDFKEYRRFVKLGLGTLIFFLIALTSNYLYVNYLNQRSADLEAEIYSFQENLSMIDRLEQEKLRKFQLVENSGIQTENYMSFYMDDIGSSVPPAVQFNSLEVFPLLEPLKPKHKVEPNATSIVINGFCPNSKILDDWIQELEEREWVGAVEVINYIRLSDKKADFHLLIKLKA